MRSSQESRIDDTVEIFRKWYHVYEEETLELILFLESLNDQAPACKSIDADQLLPDVLNKVHYYLCKYELCGCISF